MERNWTTVGAEYVPEDKRPKVAAVLDRLEWIEPKGKQLPMMPAHCIVESIRQLKLPKVTHVAISHEMAPFGLVGIRAHYKNGKAQVYVVDAGTECTPICSDFWPKEKAVTK